MVREAWREQAERRNIDIFLQGLGISPAYCNRIYRAYGNQAADIVRTNPFRLAKEIDGIGFLSADRIAGSLSIGKMDIRRIEAGILHGFDKLAQEGHTGYPETDFLEITARLLDVSEEDVKTALGNAIRNGNAVEETWNLDGIPTPMVFERDMWNQEQELASLIRNLSGPRQARTKNPATARQSDTTVELNEQQKNAVQMARANRVSVITGGPGVGKTTVVGEIVRKAQAAGLKILLAAPTGRAAKRMAESCRRPAATIHRLLKWDPAEKKFVFNSRRRLSAHLLIVDETSMLDISLAVSLFRAIAPVTTVVLVGDPDQLPSVGPGNVLHDLIRSGLCPVTHLSVVYRQSRGSRIIDNAHRVNNGVMPEFPAEEDRKTLHDCYWIEQDTPEEAVQTIVRLVRERIPKRFGFNPLSDIQVLCPMNRGSCGTAALNQLLQLELNPGKGPRIMLGERSFHPGDRVMQIRNNYEKLVFNGDLGRIGKIDTKAQTFQVDFEDRAVQYEFSETDQLTLAYAVTVHKSQGSEYPAVVVPLLTQHFLMLRRNLLYTAMTRAKRLLVFVGSQKALGIAVRNNHVEPRCTMLRRRLRGDQPISRDS
jgi:exodeoxyribonuclease V alpha subunit